MDWSPPGSSVHRILQARRLEWVAITSRRGSSWPRDGTHISCTSCIGRWVLYHSATWRSHFILHKIRSSPNKNALLLTVSLPPHNHLCPQNPGCFWSRLFCAPSRQGWLCSVSRMHLALSASCPPSLRKLKCSRSVMSDSFDPVDCSPPDSSVRGISQARIHHYSGCYFNSFTAGLWASGLAQFSVWLGLSLSSSHPLSFSLSIARRLHEAIKDPFGHVSPLLRAFWTTLPCLPNRQQMSSTGGNLPVQSTGQPCLPSPIVPDIPWKIGGYINEIKNKNHKQAKQLRRAKHYYVGLLPTPPCSLTLPSREVSSCLGLNPSPWQSSLRWSFIKHPLMPRSENVLPSSEPPGQSLSWQTITFHSVLKWPWIYLTGDSEGQGRLACCNLWGRKESDMTQWLNNKNKTPRGLRLCLIHSGSSWTAQSHHIHNRHLTNP